MRYQKNFTLCVRAVDSSLFARGTPGVRLGKKAEKAEEQDWAW